MTQKLSTYQIANVCVLWLGRTEIDNGLKMLSQIKPAGETYMHEGLIAVSQVSSTKGAVTLLIGHLWKRFINTIYYII